MAILKNRILIISLLLNAILLPVAIFTLIHKNSTHDIESIYTAAYSSTQVECKKYAQNHSDVDCTYIELEHIEHISPSVQGSSAAWQLMFAAKNWGYNVQLDHNAKVIAGFSS